MTEPLTELPKDLAERAAERHPLEALHDFCVDENAYREGNRGVAGASLKHPNSWVGSSDLGGDVIPALKGLKSAIFEAEPPDLAAMPGLRAEAAIAGLPHRHRWNLAVACAAAGERLAVLEVAAGWAGIARGLERLLVDMLKRPLEGAALSERERVEIRLFNASSRAIAWGSLVDPVIGREVPQDLTDRRAEVERRATSFAVNVFHGLGQQQWADGYAEGVNDVARKEAREAKAEAASKPEPVLGEGLMSELEALQDPSAVDKIRKRMAERSVVVVAETAVSELVKKDLPTSIKQVLGAHLAPRRGHALDHVRASLLEEFPHAVEVVDALLDGLAEDRVIRIRPAVIVGDPGGGKSRLARRVAERLHLPVATLDAGTCNDQAVTGSPRRWYSAYPSLPLATIAAHRVPNPALVVDEIEKAGRSSAGSLHDSLLSLLEPLTARAWRDQYLDAEVDLSGVSWICTANTLDGIPAPLRNRLRILRLPRPAAEHLPVLTASVLRDIAHERGEDERFLPPLDGEELSALAAAWGDSGSVRTLRRFVEALLAARRATTNPN